MVTVLSWLAGCGRIGFGANGDPGAPDAPDASDPPRTGVQVTGLGPLPLEALDLAVAPTPTGFALTWVVVGGSDMFGVRLSSTLVPDADFRVTSSNTYSGTSLCHTGTSLMTTMTTSSVTYIKRYVDDLSSYSQMAAPNGISAKPTYATVSDRWFYGVVDTTALHVHEIANTGELVGTPIEIASATGTAPLSGTMAGSDSTVFALFSNEANVCRWASVELPSLAQSSGPLDVTCARPRLVGGSRVVGVFDDGASLYQIELASTAAGTPELLVAGTDARTAADATTGLWVAYTEAGKLAVVRVLEDQVIDVPIVGVPANVAGYELVRATDADSLLYLVVIADGGLYFVQLTN